MKVYTLKRTQIIPASLAEAWAFFSSPVNLAKITPPYMKFKIVSISGGDTMYAGQVIRYRVNAFPFVRVGWVTEITHVSEPNHFIDEQRVGPFSLWHHQHHFRQHPEGVEMIDELTYALPFGIIGRLGHAVLVRRQLNAIFEFRSAVLKQIFQHKTMKISA
jgi:ligand-binding SRPBCC domain-containing protein